MASALSPCSWPQGSAEPQVCSEPDGLGSGAGSTSLSTSLDHADTRESTLQPGAFQLQHCWPQGWGGWEKDSDCGLHACVADSKSEWLRCIALAGEDVLYAATNLGMLHRVWLPETSAQEERWENLWVSPRGGPIACMVVLAGSGIHPGIPARAPQDIVLLGEQQGQATVLSVPRMSSVGPFNTRTPQGDPSQQAISWEAHDGRPVVGVFLLEKAELEGTCLACTTSMDASLRIWELLAPDHTPQQPAPHASHASDAGARNMGPAMLWEAKSPYDVRLTCVDANMKRGMLVAGDQRGNVLMFGLDAAVLGSSPGNS